MLRIYFGESDRWKGRPLHEAILDTSRELGLAGAIVYRGIEGYGSSTRIRRSRHWALSSDAPIMLSIIDAEDQIQKLISHLDEMVGGGLIAMSKVEVIRFSRAPA